MHNNHGQGVTAFELPVTVTENRDPRVNFNEAFFGRWKVNLAQKKESRQGLEMASAQKAAWLKGCWLEDGLRAGHVLILNRDGVFALLAL